jgi:hypothetical protein
MAEIIGLCHDTGTKVEKKARGLRRGEETENKLQNSAEVKVFFWAMILFFSRTYFTRLFFR